MLYGLDQELNKIKATPGAKAICPLCNKELIPKCGRIKLWHWAHKSLVECDDWYEPESEWHLNWKRLVKKEFCEVKIGNHIADIVGNFNKVIELQNSSISSEDIIKREKHYGNMIWLLNGEKFNQNLEIIKSRSIYDLCFFRWKYPRKCWWFATKPIFIDLRNEYIFKIEILYNEIPCYIKGTFMKKEHFILAYLKKRLKEDGNNKN